MIDWNDSGLAVTTFRSNGSAETTHLNWNEINGAVAYKRDIFSMDLLCVGFSTPDGSIEINEEMDGWSALTETLPAYLPGTPKPKEWMDKVIHPAFAANPTILFSLK